MGNPVYVDCIVAREFSGAMWNVSLAKERIYFLAYIELDLISASPNKVSRQRNSSQVCQLEMLH